MAVDLSCLSIQRVSATCISLASDKLGKEVLKYVLQGELSPYSIPLWHVCRMQVPCGCILPVTCPCQCYGPSGLKQTRGVMLLLREAESGQSCFPCHNFRIVQDLNTNEHEKHHFVGRWWSSRLYLLGSLWEQSLEIASFASNQWLLAKNTRNPWECWWEDSIGLVVVALISYALQTLEDAPVERTKPFFWLPILDLFLKRRQLCLWHPRNDTGRKSPWSQRTITLLLSMWHVLVSI